jgi:hypothetical protein
LDDWVEHVLNKFLKEHGPFRTEKDDQILNENDFLHLYDLIESKARFKLLNLRTENEKKRMDLFHKSFYDVKLSNDQVLASRKSYIEMIYNDMQKEIDKYRDV